MPDVLIPTAAYKHAARSVTLCLMPLQNDTFSKSLTTLTPAAEKSRIAHALITKIQDSHQQPT